MGNKIVRYNLTRVDRIENPPCIYDKYKLELIFDNGTKIAITVYADAPLSKEVLDPRATPELQDWFFVKRLLGKNGLLKKEERVDNIYLGSVYLGRDGRYVADRMYLVDNTYTAQEHFDSYLEEITAEKERRNRMVQATMLKQQSQSQPEEGLTYAISDIHGMYGSYIDAISKLKPQDNLYILGDVIDRGKYGIKILQDIIKRKNNPDTNPNITFIIGNHEWMLFETIKILERYENPKDVVNLIYDFNSLGNVIQSIQRQVNYNEISQAEGEKALRELDERKSIYRSKIKNLNISIEEQLKLRLWLFNNKGIYTMMDYLNLSDDAKHKIYEFLESSYVILPKQIAGKDILFVHAMPVPDEKILSELEKNHNGYTLKRLWDNDEAMEWLVEQRGKDEFYQQCLEHGFLTICGHTPTMNSIEYHPEKGFIRIDSGCGHKSKDSKLALYCINHNAVRMIDEREDVPKDPSDGTDDPHTCNSLKKMI